jgi:hypothetical protein
MNDCIMKKMIYVLCISVFLRMFTACNIDDTDSILDTAENIADNKPDSALILLSPIVDPLNLTKDQYARHDLFKITGSFFNPGPYSGWLAMVFPMVLGYVVLSYLNRKGHGFPSYSLTTKFHEVTQSFSLVRLWRFCGSVFNRKGREVTQSSPLFVLSSITVFCIVLILPAAMSRASWLAALGGCAFIGITKYASGGNYCSSIFVWEQFSCTELKKCKL